MRRTIVFTFLLGLILMTGSSLASTLNTVTLQVDNMTCSMCPYTVKKALNKINGVESVTAKYEGHGEGWAKVSYDADKTDIETLIKATTDAGYPSRQQTDG